MGLVGHSHQTSAQIPSYWLQHKVAVEICPWSRRCEPEYLTQQTNHVARHRRTRGWKGETRRDLVAGQPLAAEGDDRRGICCRPAPQLDRCGDDLALRSIRNAHDIGLHDVRML